MDQMSFYKSIADNYNYIFPRNPKQLEFIDRVRPIMEGERIVDIGCATGNLTSLLLRRTKEVYGIDLSGDLLDIARKKLPETKLIELNMLDLGDEFSAIDRIVSFGNTLVHLADRNQVREFFTALWNVLRPGGIYICQIINYDRIIDLNIDGLPLIENNQVRFERQYTYNGANQTVQFTTLLKDKGSGITYNNSIPLLALRREEIKEMLLEAGFKDIHFYGSLDGGEVETDSIPLIFTGVR